MAFSAEASEVLLSRRFSARSNSSEGTGGVGLGQEKVAKVVPGVEGPGVCLECQPVDGEGSRDGPSAVPKAEEAHVSLGAELRRRVAGAAS